MVDCTVLRIPVNPRDLYVTEDIAWLRWLGTVVDRVSAFNREQAARMKRGG